MAEDTAKDIVPELTPGEVSDVVRRFLFENFTIIKAILLNGITTDFVTVDNKLLIVKNGVIVDIQVSFDGLTDNLLLETGDAFLLETNDKLLFEETVV